MAAAAPIALALAVAGTVSEGIESNRAARANARISDENARLSILQGEQQALQTRRDERRMSGDMIAAMAGSGVQLGAGSAADVIAQSAYQRELEILNIRTRATGEANNLYQQGADQRRAGRAALVKSIFSAGSQALAGISDMRSGNLVRAQQGAERSATLGYHGGASGTEPGLFNPLAPPRMPVRG